MFINYVYHVTGLCSTSIDNCVNLVLLASLFCL